MGPFTAMIFFPASLSSPGFAVLLRQLCLRPCEDGREDCFLMQETCEDNCPFCVRVRDCYPTPAHLTIGRCSGRPRPQRSPFQHLCVAQPFTCSDDKDKNRCQALRECKCSTFLTQWLWCTANAATRGGSSLFARV